jgi:chromosome partitioning protein
MPILAIVNQKGGVGKTTVALGLAAAASVRGARVLVVDLDPQANATSGLGVWDPPTTVDAALESDRPGSAPALAVPSAWPVPDGAVDGATPPDVVASTPALSVREPQLANDPLGAQDRLELALQDHGYDLVVIDCPPSLGLLTVNGLFAAERALVVTEPGAWATDGVAQVQRTIGRIAARRHGKPALAGIAVNRLGRTRDARYWHEQLIEAYGDEVMDPVHLRAAVAEASAQALPIHALGARPGAAEAAAEFEALLDVVVPELARSQPNASSSAEPDQPAGAAASSDPARSSTGSVSAAPTGSVPGGSTGSGPVVATGEREASVVGAGERPASPSGPTASAPVAGPEPTDGVLPLPGFAPDRSTGEGAGREGRLPFAEPSPGPAPVPPAIRGEPDVAVRPATFPAPPVTG